MGTITSDELRMQVCVTERRVPSAADLRSAGELAPSLALPWIVRLRYGALACQIALILAARYIFGVSLPMRWIAIPLAFATAGNLLVYRCALRFGDRPALGYLLTFDTICLTALLALTGGPANPFSLLYLVQITLSAVILSKEWTWSIGALSVAGFGFLFWAHVRVSVFEAHHTNEGFSMHLAGMFIAFVAAALLVTVFIGKVSEALRRREHEVSLLQSQLARHERLTSIATLAAGAAHELGTPLGSIAIASRDVELRAARVAGDPELVSDARLIRSEVDRCRSILQRMSARSAEQPGELPVRVELASLLENVRCDFPAPDRERVRVICKGNSGVAVLPASAARQALVALMRNALDAASEPQPVTLSVERTAEWLEFAVKDSGCGMSQEMLNRIGEPFFTTKAPGSGMGLGTYLVRVFAEQLGGRLVFESEPGRGARALLQLPLIPHGD
jgi:two-component system sensor histidine kinase RegB